MGRGDRVRHRVYGWEGSVLYPARVGEVWVAWDGHKGAGGHRPSELLPLTGQISWEMT